MPDRHLRILIADDQPYMRRAVRGLLESKKSWEVCGEACDGREAIERTKQLHPDIVVMDLFMPRLNGLEATRCIHQLFPSAQVLILTLYDFPDLARLARDAGAQGYVLKPDSGQFLILAIASLGDSTPFFQPADTKPRS
jgi:DNA-binding NarL/FixJ family response regulator